MTHGKKPSGPHHLHCFPLLSAVASHVASSASEEKQSPGVTGDGLGVGCGDGTGLGTGEGGGFGDGTGVGTGDGAGCGLGDGGGRSQAHDNPASQIALTKSSQSRDHGCLPFTHGVGKPINWSLKAS